MKDLIFNEKKNQFMVKSLCCLEKIPNSPDERGEFVLRRINA